MNAAATKTANLFQVSGDGLHVSYTSSGFDGKPHLSYHDAHQSKAFVGDQINIKAAEVGTLVSVVLNPAVDTGRTTFTLFVPTVNLSLSDSAGITTIGITTLHKGSIFGQPQGQTEVYTIHVLQGTAAHVLF